MIPASAASTHLARRRPHYLRVRVPLQATRLDPSDPSRHDTGGVRAGEHVDPELGLGREPDIGRNASGCATIGILGPRRGQIKLAVRQRPTTRAAVWQEHPN
jgi:hypothetical protein